MSEASSSNDEPVDETMDSAGLPPLPPLPPKRPKPQSRAIGAGKKYAIVARAPLEPIWSLGFRLIGRRRKRYLSRRLGVRWWRLRRRRRWSH